MTKKVAINKGKIAVYLLILCAIGLVYWAYASRPNVEPEEAKPASKIMTYNNNSLKEEVDGKLIWECYAEKMSVNQDTQIVDMENIKGTFYREDGSSIEITAAKAVYDQAKKNIEITEGIKAHSTDDMDFETDKVTWDGEQRVLTCDGNVKISKPGMVATGDKAESKDAFQNFKLMGNAHIIKGDINQ